MSLIAAILVAVAVTATGPPTTPPPKVSGVSAPPPPAWVEAGSRSVWATYGSFCWSAPGNPAACVDMIAPATRPDLARLRAGTGATVRLHLRFTPRTVRVFRLTKAARLSVTRTRAGRTVSWLARPGIIDVEVTGPGGSASYLVRLSSAGT
jgi:hypothetical protein